MEENTTIIEENLESIEESNSEDLPNDDIPTSSENGTESGENTSNDNPHNDSGVSETVEESAADPEQTVSAADSTEELEEIDGELSIEEYVSGNDYLEQYAMYYQSEIDTEEEIPFLDKPLNDYTTSEGLLLLIFILALVGLLYKIIFD